MPFSSAPWSLHLRPRTCTKVFYPACAAVLCVLVALANVAGSISEPSCPGVYDQRCTLDCQLATCRALASFYRATYNPSQPWQHDIGWRTTNNSSCEDQLLSGPVYCDWEGIQCCNAEMVEAHRCNALNAVKALDLQVNGLNGSISNPAFMNSILQLHSCGASKLQLQGNDLSGSLSSSWGQLVNLTYLDLANNWLYGTIPDALQNLKRLIRLSLGTNQFSGTLPASLGELTALETLNLGANTGNNDPDAEPTAGDDVRQGLTGTIPASLANLANLTVLNLELNSLVGALPEQLCRPAEGLSRLRMLKLRGNQLSGSLEEILHCTTLAQLDVSSNDFSGPFRITNRDGHPAWPNLAVLDASSNEFNGSIPVAVYELPVLEYLNLANNRFSGQIRRHITQTMYLKELNLENNLLTGPIDSSLWLLPHLRLLDLSYNKLSGTIDSSIGQTSNLEELQLGNNNLSGPLPPQLGFLKKLDLINLLQNDNLKCPTQQHVTSYDTGSSSSSLSNNGTEFGETQGVLAVARCIGDQLLPCFLQFSNYTLPRTDASNMSCPLVLRRSYDEAQRTCAGDGAMQLGKQAHNVADAMADEQVWKLDPTYFQYKGCRCLPGYQEVWARNHTVLVCTPLPPASVDDKWITGLIQASSIAGALFLAAVALMVGLRMVVQLRPRWQREKELAANRKKGMPSNAPASIVVTDIEKYSELMQSNAPLATKALGIHNSILRRAATAHAGNVVEQEGDSWSVAFHTPTDAVAFCLQVQQALHRVNWPRDLASSGSQISCAPRTKSGTLDSVAAAPPGTVSAGNFAVTATTPAAAAVSVTGPDGEVKRWQQQQQHEAFDISAAPESWVRVPARLWHRPGAAAAASFDDNKWDVANPGSSPSSSSSSDDKPDLLPSIRASCAGGCGSSSSSRPHSFCISSSDPSASSFICKNNVLGLGTAAIPPAAAAADGTVYGSGSSSKLRQMISLRLRRSSRFWSIIGSNPAAAAVSHGSSSNLIQGVQANHVRGLRVRMGVASGCVPGDTDIARCALFELAKGVSDLAHGGQVLLDSVTFAGIRDRLTELGGVDHRGYNDITVAVAARAAMKKQTAGLLCKLLRCLQLCLCLTPRDEQQYTDSDALLLDMGEYYLPNLAAAIPAAAAAGSTNQLADTGSLCTLIAADQPVPHDAALAAAAAASAISGSNGSSKFSNQLLQLYSILPWCLADRAYEFGGVVNTKEGDHQTALTYFDAPGTDVARLGTQITPAEPFSNTSTPNSTAAAAAGNGQPFSRAPLPYVTMMFVAVEGGSVGGRGSRGHDDVARILHNTISRTMQVLLLAFADGSGGHAAGTCYLCREQSGDLRYMLAFRDPAQAAEWALCMQEIMLYIPWSQAVFDAFALSTPTQASTAAVSAFDDRSSSNGLPVGRPALHISFAEGQPHSIGPDHLGRADYHGPSVNTAARMLAAAAAGSGGRIATSVELAQAIFSTWCYQAAVKQAQDTKATATATAAKQRLVGVDGPPMALTAWQRQQQQQQQPHKSPEEMGASPNIAKGSTDTLLPVLADAAGSSSSSSALLSAVTAAAACDPSGAPKDPSSGRTSYPNRLIHVSGWHIGTYQFKGCGTADMIAITADMHKTQRGLHDHCHHLQHGMVDLGSASEGLVHHSAPASTSGQQPQQERLDFAAHRVQQMLSKPLSGVPLPSVPAAGSPARGGKGQLLLPRDGPVVGLQNCPVLVPDVLLSLNKAWQAAMEVAVGWQASRMAGE